MKHTRKYLKDGKIGFFFPHESEAMIFLLVGNAQCRRRSLLWLLSLALEG